MPVCRLTIEYDGSRFSGWQVQPDCRTVQGELKKALATVMREPVDLQGAARTDAGVHALGQVASFEAQALPDPERLARSVSALAGPDVAVTEAALAPDGFNARFDATGKRYCYAVLSRPTPSPLFARTSWFVPRPLDLGAMRAAARVLVGTHDFAGFRSSDCGRKTTERTMARVEISEHERGLVTIDVEGTAFLKNMVRIMAGTLVAVGHGRFPPDVTARLLETKDRTKAGPTAPPHGLTLVEVLYPEGGLRRR
ncbi:MAG: tRNA pseudouridine(38-40) synthase TruA [Deltaproteobacteria bacterium]|nr:tRNA pseudouridine(38-40) synthase TruA [Deltaproteobacteria bacterium]